ncbi:hypothetical protein BDF20DRAFT_915577 [Mycotypha africana]|uniref:uncharacterized protein n=1 Tax=Mycotypha africana TaxID=64632 RepID=UPI002300F42C|nr:uncharacterized protein BDF20DRAFT_915577 [Mycotypha africana]KAI8971814.1 hypothetical protein BDF20DRAFT_915577 [Mycotypha africana]
MQVLYNSYDHIFRESEENDTSLDQMREFLEFYKLDQYFSVFVHEGFDRLLSLFDITEVDLISLNVKRGHRRLLQRAIATARGVPISTPIIITYGYLPPYIGRSTQGSSIMVSGNSSNNDNRFALLSTTTPTTTILERPQDTLLSNTQQQYLIKSPFRHRTTRSRSNSVKSHPYQQKRHHKRKTKYVPARPITAFDEFARRLKAELGDLNLNSEEQSTSADFINLAYDRWQELSNEAKEIYEREALLANANLNVARSSGDIGSQNHDDKQNADIDWYDIEYYQRRYHRNRDRAGSRNSGSSTPTTSDSNNDHIHSNIDSRLYEQKAFNTTLRTLTMRLYALINTDCSATIEFEMNLIKRK